MAKIILGATKNIPMVVQSREETMVAVKTTLKAASASIEPENCPHCQGNGTVRYSNEISYFEDLRSCERCDAGREVEMKIGEIIRRAHAEERFPRRHHPNAG